jgi:8-oxo-dGTP pyrophosphatase MutT (NUDIX family)
MKFNNRPNLSHNVDGRIIWESRSVAVTGTVILYLPGEPAPFVLCSMRGPNAADYSGYMNLIAGYMDWDESGPEALYRETWEEVGLDLKSLVYPERDKDCFWVDIVGINLDQPWLVKTDPSENHQNISLRYGVALKMRDPVLPMLCLDYNEVPGEIEHAGWLRVNELDTFKWAFGHDKVIKEYLVQIGDHICNY